MPNFSGFEPLEASKIAYEVWTFVVLQPKEENLGDMQWPGPGLMGGD